MRNDGGRKERLRSSNIPPAMAMATATAMAMAMERRSYGGLL
jgi:hypothetical protein